MTSRRPYHSPTLLPHALPARDLLQPRRMFSPYAPLLVASSLHESPAPRVARLYLLPSSAPRSPLGTASPIGSLLSRCDTSTSYCPPSQSLQSAACLPSPSPPLKIRPARSTVPVFKNSSTTPWLSISPTIFSCLPRLTYLRALWPTAPLLSPPLASRIGCQESALGTSSTVHPGTVVTISFPRFAQAPAILLLPSVPPAIQSHWSTCCPSNAV